VSTILGLALKVTGDASSLAKSLDPVDKALQRIGAQAERATAVFAPFTAASAAAARAQEQFAERFGNLAQQLQDDIIGPQEFAAAFAQLKEEAEQAADVFERGIRTTAQYATEQQDAAGKITKLVEELRAGAIDAPTFERALASLAGVDLSSSEDAARFIRTLAENAREGTLDIERAAASLTQLSEANATASASQASLATASRQANLQLSELSGLLSLLPGNMGAVAGRVSALSGAVQGFEKLAAGGLNRSVETLGSSFGALATPVGLGVAAIAGFGAAAASIIAGLRDLEGRVEALGFAAQQAGTDFQTIQVLDEAARRTGTSVDALASGVQKFAVTIDKARSGSGEAAAAFRELGISQEALANSTPVQLAEQTAEALAKIEDPARRSALQVDLLGKSGETLRRGFSAFTEAEDAIARFGATLSGADLDLISRLGSSFDDLQTSLAGLSLNTLKPFIDAVASGTSALAEFFGTASRVFTGLLRVAQPFIDGFADGMKIVGFAFEQINDGIDFVFGTAEKTTEAVGKVRREAEKPLERGFARDFDQAMKSVNEQLSRASLEAERFGVAGARAFAEYDRVVEGLRERFNKRIIDETAFSKSIERANEQYRQQIDLARRAAEEVSRKVQADRDASDALIEQQRILQNFDGDTQRAEAAQNVLRLEREIARVRQEIAGVNPFGDVARAGDERILQLQKIAEQQREIANGNAQISNAASARVDALLKATQERSTLEQQILDYAEEQARLEVEINTAIIERRTEDEAAARARLASVEGLRTAAEDLQQATEQGFTGGFSPAFQETDRAVDELITKVEQFGNAGAIAAKQLEDGVARAQALARQPGGLAVDVYQRLVAQQQKLFEDNVARLEELKRREQENAQLVFQAKIDANNRVDQILAAQLDNRQRAELEAVKEREEREKQAELNIQAIRDRIKTQERALEAARENARETGDMRGLRAGVARLNQLRQAERAEQRIIDGRQQAERISVQQFQQGTSAAQQFQSLIARQNDAFLSGFQNAYAGANAALAQSARVAEEQARRMEALTRPTTASANVADIRTAEGQALVQDVAAQAQDPALIEARLQTRALQAISQAVLGASAQYLSENNAPVAIVGAARLG
jgi:hypothetical protein